MSHSNFKNFLRKNSNNFKIDVARFARNFVNETFGHIFQHC